MMKRDGEKQYSRLVAAWIIVLACSACCWAVFPAWAEDGLIDGRNLADFEGVGHIDRMEGDTMVINDCQMKLAPNASYYKQGRRKIKKSSFAVGSKVGFLTNRRGDITSLWLLP